MLDTSLTLRSMPHWPMSYPAARVYAAASRFHHRLSGTLDHPLEPVIGRRAAPSRWPI